MFIAIHVGSLYLVDFAIIASINESLPGTALIRIYVVPPDWNSGGAGRALGRPKGPRAHCLINLEYSLGNPACDLQIN